MELDGRFWLSKDGENFLGRGRIELLKLIDKTGSINAAAKEMKMSYKAAWERINSMNQLADEPLIIRSTGGKGGGGTTLTPYAHNLIATFERFYELHREFIGRFKEAGDNPKKLANILSRTFLTTSARNQIPSTIKVVEDIGLNVKLTLSISNTIDIVAIITKYSFESMGLDIGSDVYAIIKSSDIELYKNQDDENIFDTEIIDITSQDNSTSLSLRLNDNKTTIYMMSNESIVNDGSIKIQINPKNIIIGI